MIKDIIVNLIPGQEFDPAGRYAISLAEAYNAHITGVAFSLMPPWPPYLIEGAAVDIFRTAKDASKKDATDALANFDAATKRSQLSAQQVLMETSLLDATEIYANLARTYDLSVVNQPNPDSSDYGTDMIEASLFNSGRPTLVVPYIQKDGFAPGRVVCCWDGSRAAARAIGDSLPLLARANNVQVLTVVTEKFDERDVTGADVAAHLARHKLKTELVRMPAADMDVASVILSHISDTNANLLVMGGFGHSRLREFVLGGATRGILKNMTIPVLMSH